MEYPSKMSARSEHGDGSHVSFLSIRTVGGGFFRLESYQWRWLEQSEVVFSPYTVQMTLIGTLKWRFSTLHRSYETKTRTRLPPSPCFTHHVLKAKRFGRIYWWVYNDVISL